MLRSLGWKLAAGLLAIVVVASLGVFSSPYHDEEVVQQKKKAQRPITPGPTDDQTVRMPRGLIGLEIALGLRDSSPTDWDGDLTVSEGRVSELEIVRSAIGASVEGNRFALGTTKNMAKKKKKAQANGAVLSSILRTNLEAPESATVTIRTGQGRFSLKLSELTRGAPKLFLGGQASVERQDAAVRLTGAKTEDDFPAVTKTADGSVWLAYVEYRPEISRLLQRVPRKDFDTLVPTTNGDKIRLRRFDGKDWSPAIDVTAGGLDVWRPTIAADGRGNLVVAWSQQLNGDWEIYRRTFTPAKAAGGTWSDITRVSEAKGSDFHVVSAVDAKGVVWLAWQGWREGNYDIFVSALADGHSWQTPKAISESRANDWSPVIAADSQGRVFVAWDTYDQGQYDVRLREVGKTSPILTVAGTPRFEARPSLAVDARDRVWIAYEQGDEQWGKDYSTDQYQRIPFEKNPGFALYINRTVRVKCLDGGNLKEPEASLQQALGQGLNRKRSLPRLAFDEAGGLWLLLRHATLPGGAGESWSGFALRYDGTSWSSPRRLTNSSNLLDNRPATVPFGSGLLAVYSSDNRTNTATRGQDDLFASMISANETRIGIPKLIADSDSTKATVVTVHPDEKAQVARMRDYRLTVGGKPLQLLRGEFHRHTEFSSHNDGDGLLEDAWRYALDAASHDWMGDGDHDNGFGHEYMWWLIQKVTDLHHNPGFIAAQTYERSVVYPNGHRNVMMPKRGIRPLPRGALQGTPEQGTPDTKDLYAYLKHFGGICASHTSATGMGTDWRDNDPLVEPVVEIYQGHRHNYEHPGAPRSPTEATQIGGYEPAGFIWNAFDKGYRLGFQSSSDHVSTHGSYAIVLTHEVSRQGIIDAFKARHCYAATDNILLDVRSGEHLMGDAFETNQRPRLEINVLGTATVSKLHIIRDNKYVLSIEPNTPRVKLSYSDDDGTLKAGMTHYYYVRVQQADGNLAWASPMWISYKPQ
jgi:hypothetical protein